MHSEGIPDPVIHYCQEKAFGPFQSVATLTGGIQSRVCRLFTQSGITLILKRHDSAPDDWYALEAEGLRLLDLPGCPHVPKVLIVDPKFLLLEDVTGEVSAPATDSYWQSFGQQLATLHSHTQPLHGFSHDNYLGLTRQTNRQYADGREFYVENRVLHYLRQPLCQKTLTREDRKGVERLCERIRRDFPDQPASLCHGDLWTGNMLVSREERPAYIDPAIHYGPAEAELSLTRQFGGVPDAFYHAYSEVLPLQPGWEDRLRIYELKEMLALIAQFADEHEMVAPLRELIAQYA